LTAGVGLHFLFEALGYALAAGLYLKQRRRLGDPLPDDSRVALLVAAAVGAAVGSRLLFWLCEPRVTLAHARDLSYLAGGKTIVGALLGGLAAVEWTKRRAGVTVPTGDLYVLPLCAGMAVGRIGCFLAGPADHTAGTPTSLPWGIAWGDGVRRHPTALYEIVFLALLAWSLSVLASDRRRPGLAFALFLSAYLAFRLAVDFVKPEPPPLWLGLSAIQIACVAGLGYYAVILPRRFRLAGSAELA
jgi:phosphatidylglycerol:prolipoprotein diacylglycerol transferase